MAAYFEFMTARGPRPPPPRSGAWAAVTSARMPPLAELMLFDRASLVTTEPGSEPLDLICERDAAARRFALRRREAEAALAALAVPAADLAGFARFIDAADAHYVRLDLSEPHLYLSPDEAKAFRGELDAVLAALDRPALAPRGLGPDWARALAFCGFELEGGQGGRHAALTGTVLADNAEARLLLAHVPSSERAGPAPA